MFELANRLIGIFKTNDITKCLTYINDKVDEEEEKIWDKFIKIYLIFDILLYLNYLLNN